MAGVAALSVPSAGVLDAGDLVRALSARASGRGAEILTQAEVTGIAPASGGVEVVSSRGPVKAGRAFNCAGLFSGRVAAMAGRAGYQIHPCRGEYCEVSPARADLVKGLVYPAPHPGPGLGVHLTRTVDGALLLGPNARYVSGPEDYEQGRAPAEDFLESARRLLPALAIGDLRPGYAGIRAKLAPGGDTDFRDFVIEKDPGLPGLTHLVGIESPGLTACLALAKEAAGR